MMFLLMLRKTQDLQVIKGIVGPIVIFVMQGNSNRMGFSCG